MNRHMRLLQVSAFAAALGVSGLPAAAQHTDRRGDAGGGQGTAQPRGGDGQQQPARGRQSDGGHQVESAPPPDNGGERQRDTARQRDPQQRDDARQRDNARQQEQDNARQQQDNARQRDNARQHQDNARQQQDNARQQDYARQRDGQRQQPDQRAYGNTGRDPRYDGQVQRNYGRDARSGGNYGGYSGGSNNGRAVPPTRGYAQRRDPRDGSYYYAPSRSYNPRTAPRGWAPRRIYGSGGRQSVFFGWGSGYRFGSPYYGRVYGYSAPITVYGSARRYYGDVRLRVNPRWAEVYVDGYYAGVVDEFDGIFQRLTIEVGPHEIEVTAPGYESQFFDVYVDPDRTIELRGDLYPLR